jgi:hypothetical protein
MVDPQRLKETMRSVIAGMMDELVAGVETSESSRTGVPHEHDPLWAALIPAGVSRGADAEKRFQLLFDCTKRKLAAMIAAESMGYGAESYSIVGTIRTGRLKRIAQVLHQSEHSEAGQHAPKSDWASELVFITRGRGERIPVRMICDLYAEDTSSKRRYAFELPKSAPDRYALKAVQEGLLKLYSMDRPQVDEAYVVLPYESVASKQADDWNLPAGRVVLTGDEFWEKIGGAGTYQALLDTARDVGIQYEPVWRKYM